MSRMAANLSLESSQKAQIDELVQQKRKLEQTNKLLRTQADAALQAAHTKFRDEQVEWRNCVSTLQSCHFLSQLRVQVEADGERLNTMREQEKLRQEKIARIQRDFQLVQFQKSENELSSKLSILEGEVAAARALRDERVEKFKQANTDSIATIQALTRKAAVKDKENEELSKKIAYQLDEIARIKAEHASLLPKLERANLLNDDAASKQAELRREVDDLKRAKSDLERQLDKWRSLETKGGEDMEKERKRRIELEAEVEALTAQLTKLQETYTEKKVRYRQSLSEYEDHITSQEEMLHVAQMQLSDASETIAALERKVNRLEARRSPVAGPSKPNSRIRASQQRESEPDVEIEEQTADVPKARKPKAPKKPPADSEIEEMDDAPAPKSRKPRSRKKDSEIEELEDAPTPKTSKSRARVKSQQPPSGSEIEEIAEIPPKTKGKGKGKAKALEQEDDSLHEVDEAVHTKPKRKLKAVSKEDEELAKCKGKSREDSAVDATDEIKRKGKKRLIDELMADDIEQVDSETVVASTAQKGRKRAPSRAPSASATVKPASRQRSRAPSASAVSTSVDGDGQKKKRKINIFPNSGAPQFNFGTQSGLGIPTALSPVKEQEAPPRSLSSFGSLFFRSQKK